MGYRSQVAIAFEKEAFWKHVGEDIKNFKDCDLIQQTKESITFLWEDVKWYDSYDDVQSVSRVINRVASDESYQDDDHYGFIRIGEDDSDIEKAGSPWEFGLDTTVTLHTDDEADDISHDDFFAPNSIKFIKGDDE